MCVSDSAPLNIFLIYIKITIVLATLSEDMDKKFEVNRTKIKGKAVSHIQKLHIKILKVICLWD